MVTAPRYLCVHVAFVADPGLFFFSYLFGFGGCVLCGGRICSDIRIEACGAELSRFAHQMADRGKERGGGERRGEI